MIHKNNEPYIYNVVCVCCKTIIYNKESYNYIKYKDIITGEVCDKCKELLKTNIACIKGTFSSTGELLNIEDDVILINKKDFNKVLDDHNKNIHIFPEDEWNKYFGNYKFINNKNIN